MDGVGVCWIDYGDEMNLCACMGPMYGEPYCPCTMEELGRKEEMLNNPLRIADKKKLEEWLASLSLYEEAQDE